MGFVSNAAKSIIRDPLNILPAVVGVATGNPWLAAATAGGITAIRGGNSGDILTSAAITGIGGAAGNMIGSQPMYISRYLGGSEVVKAAVTGFGTHLGSGAYEGMRNNRSAMAPVQASTPLTPSMEDMRRHAVAATFKSFTENNLYTGMYGVTSKYMKMLNKHRPRYGYRKWKDLVSNKV